MNNQIASNYYAEVYFPGSLAEIQVTASAVYEKVVTGDTEPVLLRYGFQVANGKVTFIGEQESAMVISLLVRVAHSGKEDREIKIACSKNNSLIPESEIIALVKGESIYKTMNASFELTLVPNDEIEWWVCNEKGTETIFIKDLKYTFSKK